MRKQKTYKNKLTRRQKEKEKQKVALAFLITFMVGFGSYIMAEAYRIPEPITEVKAQKKEARLPQAEDRELSEMTVTERIAKVAKEEGRTEWTDYLIKLSFCESRLDPKATNSQGNNPSWSVDRGLFQYNSHWQPQVSDECAFSIECSTRKTIEFIEKGSQGLWVCDDYVKGVPKHIVMQ